jgi:hypothetical protein
MAIWILPLLVKAPSAAEPEQEKLPSPRFGLRFWMGTENINPTPCHKYCVKLAMDAAPATAPDLVWPFP